MSVLLPAPFSPTRAWTSPGRRSKSTSSTAVTPPKRLVTLRRRKIAGASATVAAPPAPGSSDRLMWLDPPRRPPDVQHLQHLVLHLSLPTYSRLAPSASR